MRDTPRTGHGEVTTLWRLSWQNDSLACVVYREADGMELRLESPRGTILSEPFRIEPRLLARTKALRAALVRRGWQDV